MTPLSNPKPAKPGPGLSARGSTLGQRTRQRGNIAPFMALAMGGVLMATAYALDTSRMVNGAAQVKRATDAAAMAVGNERLINKEATRESLNLLAYNYVTNNLGMDSELAQQIDRDSLTLTESEDDEGHTRYKVQVAFHADPELLGGERQLLQVHSTVEVVSRATEVALVLPNTGAENDTELAALRRLGKFFASSLLDDGNDQQRTWLSLVPYSQAVNVYDANARDRVSRWATSQALNPVELRSLFRTGKISSLGDQRTPDLKTRLTCLNRGLLLGENYFWDRAPAGQFTRVYYRHDLPENDPTAASVSWVGPNPDFGQANGANDTRWIVADKGCPKAAVLPLSKKMEDIEERLDSMRTGFNVNYAIAMGWGAMTLAPRFRGSAGWGDSELPLDFSNGDSDKNVKIVVMLANTKGDWFDSDAYNTAVVGQAIGSASTGTQDAVEEAGKRFISLCNSFKERKLKFYFIGVRPGDPEDFGRGLFGRVAVPGLSICTQGTGGIVFANASNFVEGEKQIHTLLEDIAKKIKHEYYARLVE